MVGREGGSSRCLHSRDHGAWLPNAEYYREENRGTELANKSSLGGGDGHERVNVYMTITGAGRNTPTTSGVGNRQTIWSADLLYRTLTRTCLVGGGGENSRGNGGMLGGGGSGPKLMP